MNLETFFNQFELLADAPNGVQKLRELILQLAVMGKLVPQDENDEPASILLERIKAEKAKLVKENKISKDKKYSSVVSDIPPWNIPSHWQWTRMQNIFEITRGGSPRPSKDPRFFGGNIPWITVNEITKNSEMYLLNTKTGLTDLGSSKSRFIFDDDILLTNSGATLGVPKISKIKGCINDGVARLYPFHEYINKQYAYYFLFGQTQAFRDVNQGMGQPNLNTSILAAWFFPLPPLKEQYRIVKKIDQLMNYCDELEQQLTKGIEDKEKLIETAIYQLLAA
ncbi:restriction endonuclease subunit S [Cyanothece sp. BG0011]|uniref:restriction endonuclease subunit S n=1 Tax=Cyanothece sp. BG0011 TaxID=2082950 RepID=UPI000D1F4DC3|nr:restriction endonuclease subunit S [Cyanothece sp. BG0011]